MSRAEREAEVSSTVATRLRADLPVGAVSVSQARAFVRRSLQLLGLDGALDPALLLTSELATNAVLHARSGFTVCVEQRGNRVRVSLLDDSPVRPTRRTHGLEATTGRGLALVDTLAVEWGAVEERELEGRTKGVWFELTRSAGEESFAEGALYGEDWLAAIEDL